MEVKVNTDLERLQLKARDAIEFIEDHPAIGSTCSNMQRCLWFSIQTVCKRGYSEHCISDVRVYNEGENAERFKEQFKIQMEEDKDDSIMVNNPSLVSISVPYEQLFGEPWKFDHIDFWGELSIVVYDTKAKDDIKEIDRWIQWSGVEAKGRTYEEMIINLAEELKKEYGDFNSRTSMTAEELKNNDETDPFYFKDISDRKGYVEMIRNENFIHISDAEKNIRWQKWMKENKNKTFEL